MYICNRCGHLTENLDVCLEGRGYAGSFVGFEEVDAPCSCGGDFVEADKCPVCGEWYEKGDTDEYCCPDCIDDNCTVEKAIAYAKDCEDITSDGVYRFFVEALGGEAINKILEEYVLANPASISHLAVSKYCKWDTAAFGGFLADTIGDGN